MQTNIEAIWGILALFYNVVRLKPIETYSLSGVLRWWMMLYWQIKTRTFDATFPQRLDIDIAEHKHPSNSWFVLNVYSFAMGQFQKRIKWKTRHWSFKRLRQNCKYTYIGLWKHLLSTVTRLCILSFSEGHIHRDLHCKPGRRNCVCSDIFSVCYSCRAGWSLLYNQWLLYLYQVSDRAECKSKSQSE